MLPPLLHLRGKDQRARIPDQGIAVAANPVEPSAQAGVDGAAWLRLRGGCAERACGDPAGRPREQRVEPTSSYHHLGTSRDSPRGAPPRRASLDSLVSESRVAGVLAGARDLASQSRAGGNANT